MKVSGFSFIRNAIKYDYPIKEAILSILPICDEFVIAVGKSEDETYNLIKSIDSVKLKIIETVWNDNLRQGGKVLAEETNKALKAISSDSDWAFYIQGDEVVHEKYLPVIQQAMMQWKDDAKVEGLLLNYLHFYGSYDYVGDSRRWYRKEIRIIKPHPDIHSYKDAQGFRKRNKLIKVKQIDAYIYHYGWVKPPELQQAKQKFFHKLWHDDKWIKNNIPDTDYFDYSQIDSLQHFKGTHPKVMLNRINEKNWFFSFDPTNRKNLKGLNKILYWIEKKMNYRIGEYKNYKLL
ncbi:MAG TPA: hypothetical protein P5250_02490 [Bacteroidales bacterium]|nr:hypothetical protein [Bacteroidales bacterium]